MAANKAGVLIVGAGKGGTALVEMFAKSGVANILAVIDKDAGAPGMKKAQMFGFETGGDYGKYLNSEGLDLIIDVTGDSEVRRSLVESKPQGVDVIGGYAARLMWNLVNEHVDLEDRYNRQMRSLERIQDDLHMALVEWDHTFDGMPDGITIHDVEYNITNANRAICNMLGVSKEDLIGKKCYRLFHSTMVPLDGCPMTKAMRAGATSVKEIYEPSLKKWLSVSAAPVRNEMGEIVKVIHAVRDVTDRKIAEEELYELSEFTRRVIDSLTHPFYVVNANDHTIKMANKAAKLHGPEGASKCYELIHRATEPCSDERPCPLEEVKKTKKPVVMEHEHFEENGEVRYCEVHGYPLFDRNGDVAQMIEYTLDITDRKRVEEVLVESEKRYRQLIENAPMPILVAQDLTIKFANPRVSELAGCNYEELLNTPLANLIHPDDRDMVIERHRQRLVGEDAPTSYSFRTVTSTGEIRWVELNVVRIDWAGRPATLNFLSDISKRRDAEEEVRAAREYLEAIISSMTDGLWVIGLDGNTVDVNRAAVELFGCSSKQELLRKNTADVMVQKDMEGAKALMERTLRGESGSAEFEIVRGDGKLLPVQVTASSLKDSDGMVMGGFAVIKDIAERKEMQEIREGLIIDVTHELKSPIALMEMAYDMCERGIESKDFKRIENSQSIAAINLARFSADVYNILDMFSVGIKRDEEQLIELDRLVASAIDDLMPLIENKELEMKVDIPNDASLLMMSGREASCLARNIIGNAVKFTKDGRIEIFSSREGDKIKLTVKDTGCGIKKDDMGRIFDRFFKGSAIMPGTGLGLSVCKKVIELCGGSIEVKSDGAWKGTTVTVRLPRG